MIGNTLSHYKIISKLGQGGMGEVYLAEDSRLKRKVALKILPQHLSDRAELRERFEREARAVSSLNHPHICTLHDIGEQDSIHFLVMGVRDIGVKPQSKNFRQQLGRWKALPNPTVTFDKRMSTLRPNLFYQRL